MQQSYCKNKKTMVRGISGMSKNTYWTANNGFQGNYSDIDGLYKALRDKKVFLYPAKRFSRFDAVSKITCCLIALALKDAGIEYSNEKKMDIGIVSANRKGSLDSNCNYFKDYVTAGRTLGRGNLFLYTLPTSPIAESAINFKLRGELCYVNLSDCSFLSFLNYAETRICQNRQKTLLAVKADEKQGACFVLNKEFEKQAGERYCLKDLKPKLQGISKTEKLKNSLNLT